MKKLTAIFLCVFMLAALSGYWAEAAPSSGAPDSTDSGQSQTDSSDTPTSWIVGMWRQDDTSVHKRSDWAVCQIFYTDGSVIHIGIREYSDERIIDVTLGKYRLNGSTLKVYDVTGFVMNSRSVLSRTPNYGSNYRQIKNIVQTGSRSEIEELTDPNHTLYSAYTSAYGHWESWSDRDDELNIIDANSFVTEWARDYTWGLKRVQE